MGGPSYPCGMCLIAFHWRPESPVPLILAANRDEFYERPTAPLAWWEGRHILVGQDLRAGGTWLGVTGNSRCAAITNYRDPRLTNPGPRSNGSASLEAALDDNEALLGLLGNAKPFEDDRLPSTGVPIEWERALSPAFIRAPTAPEPRRSFAWGVRAGPFLNSGSSSTGQRRGRKSGSRGVVPAQAGLHSEGKENRKD